MPDRADRARLGLPEEVDACLFDLDGVLADTTPLHVAAWKQTFDELLRRRDGASYVPFDPVRDYQQFVDGKRRLDGVRGFLRSRAIELPGGGPGDAPDADTVHALGERKNELLLSAIDRGGVQALPGVVDYLRAARDAGLRRAVVSSSANCRQVVETVGLADLLEERVDGVTARELSLPGKPAPDTFLHGARLLGVEPARAAVYEDALAGVEAGRAGAFGFVVGVGGLERAGELREHGADVVVASLGELLGGVPA